MNRTSLERIGEIAVRLVRADEAYQKYVTATPMMHIDRRKPMLELNKLWKVIVDTRREMNAAVHQAFGKEDDHGQQTGPGEDRPELPR